MSFDNYRSEVRQQNKAFLKSLSRDEKDARIDGEFFTVLEAICVTDEMVPIESSQFSIIRRSPSQGSTIYPNTSDESLLESCEESKSEKSDSTNTHQRTTTVDFLWNEQGERAHLFPNAPVCHAAYFRLAQAASGFFVEDYAKRRKLLNGMHGRTRRLRDSGIKHSKYNKFHLFLQKELFDATPPSLIIIPLLSLSQIRAWNGTTPYEAMVLPCGMQAAYAAAQTLKYARSTCTQQQVQVGVQVLSTFVKDIAGSLLDEEHDVLDDFNVSVGDTRDGSAVTWKKLVEYLRTLDSPSYPLPSLKDDLDWTKIHVAKGTFDRDTSCLPDPFLLATKAAINYSSHVGKKLMPACSISSVVDDADDDSLVSCDP